MEDRDFDIVVVGCGCAGAIAAFVAAKKGKSVLVVERGDFAGAKNQRGTREVKQCRGSDHPARNSRRLQKQKLNTVQKRHKSHILSAPKFKPMNNKNHIA